MQVRPARDGDVPLIVELLRANASEPSLFQQPPAQVCRTLADFLIAVDDDGAAIGCAALHRHSPDSAEILAVAVAPSLQARGTGAALMRACLARAAEGGVQLLWLATAKPAYFARFGFHAFSRWRLGPRVLLYKLLLVLQQPIARWLPALFGRHTFMRLPR